MFVSFMSTLKQFFVQVKTSHWIAYPKLYLTVLNKLVQIHPDYRPC